jgi:molybdate transport system substrate-binding protein
MTTTLRILSGGAAQALVEGVRDELRAVHGIEVQATFGAVGAMRDRLLAGEACDVLILTQALVDQLAKDGRADPASAQPLGIVKTGVAVKDEAPVPDVSTADALRSALAKASAVFCPDTQKATAGIHFLQVLRTLGIAQQLGTRLREFPNGAAAMKALSECKEADAIGCTQVTEILYAPGVRLAGLLPREFELATVYTAAATTSAQPAAAEVIRTLSAPGHALLRQRCGFE